MLLLVITAKVIWLSLHWLYWICLYDPSKLIHSLSEQRKRWRSEENSERKQSRLRGFNICLKEYCRCHPVVIQHDKLKRECYYTFSQKRKQRCHIQNRKQESRYDLARLSNPLPKKPNTNTERPQRCLLVYYVSLRELEGRKGDKNAFSKMKLPNHFHITYKKNLKETEKKIMHRLQNCKNCQYEYKENSGLSKYIIFISLPHSKISLELEFLILVFRL